MSNQFNNNSSKNQSINVVTTTSLTNENDSNGNPSVEINGQIT